MFESLLNFQFFNIEKRLKYIIIISIIYLIIFLLILKYSLLSERFIYLPILIPLLILISFNFKFSFYVLILSLFFQYSIYYFSISILLTPFIIIAFFINITFKKGEIDLTIFKYLLFFIIPIIPSYVLAINYPEAILLNFNLFAFIVLILITSIAFNNTKEIRNIFNVFLLGAVTNSFFLIYQALFLQKRVFGFAGIMFVDLVGVAIIISFSFFLLYKDRQVLYALITLILLTALLFTQTRNSWISTGMVLVLMTFHYSIKSHFFNLDRIIALKKNLIVIIGLLIIIMLFLSFMPGVFSRLSAAKPQSIEEMSLSITDINSLATRFFIWLTAYNVFINNPIIGTGFHSFRFISFDYNTLDPLIYDLFVKDLTPHTTVLAILADTGILGFIGFSIFFYLTFRMIKRNLNRSTILEEKILSFIIYWIIIFIALSMIMTDAWLWGTLHSLWAIILGIAIVIKKRNQSEVFCKGE